MVDGFKALNRIVQAISYYTSADCGFEFVDTPWLVTEQVFQATAPAFANPFRTTEGEVLVGSAEQGFVQMTLEGTLPIGKYISYSPCFRGDQEDELHRRWFHKAELFQSIDVDETNLKAMVVDALHVLGCYINVEIEKTADGCDIVASKTGIELGSYGIKYYGGSGHGIQWIYGTAIAEPRLSLAIAKENDCL